MSTAAPRRERWLVAATEYAGLTAYTGGIGSHYAALLPALVRRGVDVDLIVFTDAPTRADAVSDGVRVAAVHRTDGIGPTAVLWHRARLVRAAYAARPYDRVFLPEWSALGAALPAGAPLLTNLATGTRLANEISGLRLRDLPWARRLPVAVQGALEARQMRRSAGLIAISTAMLERTRRRLRAPPPFRVVPNCIDVAGARAGATASRPAGWPAGDDPVALFLGRSERRKGVVDAVVAFGLLHQQVPAARLVLAGAGGDARYEPTRDGLLAMLPPAARERVTWLGHVAGDQVYAAIRAATVVLCPSRWEGFGNVALEVKAVGTPLIVTSGSGFDDFCEDGVDCAMVPPADPGALARAMRRVLDDPGWARARSAAASARVEAFAPDPVAALLLSAADDLLGPVRR